MKGRFHLSRDEFRLPIRHPNDRGAVMVIALLALVLLAAMVFYVFNVGHHVATKVETQNAADATAISGARSVARSFNTVAMNNVETTRLIAYAAVLDAVPQAIDYTIADQTAVRDAIDRQLAQDLSAMPWLGDGLREARFHLADQLDLLRPLQELFDSSSSGGGSGVPGGYDVARMTYYQPAADVPGSRPGELWRAIDALANLSRATMQTVSPLAMQNASAAAQANQTAGGGSGNGVLIPWNLEIPWQQGDFEDFRLPVIEGRLPPAQDDPVTNRGPFDTLFGFREYRFTTPTSGSPPSPRDLRNPTATPQADRVTHQDFRLRDWVPVDNDRVISREEATGYRTYGAYLDMRRSGMDLGRSPQGHASPYQQAWPSSRNRRIHPLAPSLWARHLAFLADRKINYCFPGVGSNRVVRKPEWILNYDRAVEIERTGQPSIGHALYLVFDYARNERIEGVDLVHPPPVLQRWGLYRADRDILNPPGLTKIANHIWLDQRIELRRLPPGSGSDEDAAYRRRTVRYYVFVGIQVGEPVAVRNPFNFDAEDRSTLPGPINFPPEFDPRQRNLVPGAFGRGDRALTYLGVAYQPKRASMWAEGFDANRPDQYQVAVAQAQVFNNHSWDLWTPMWHSQLTPIDRYGDWLDLADQSTNDGGEDFPAVAEYLRATRPLVDLMSEP